MKMLVLVYHIFNRIFVFSILLSFNEILPCQSVQINITEDLALRSKLVSFLGQLVDDFLVVLLLLGLLLSDVITELHIVAVRLFFTSAAISRSPLVSQYILPVLPSFRSFQCTCLVFKCFLISFHFLIHSWKRFSFLFKHFFQSSCLFFSIFIELQFIMHFFLSILLVNFGLNLVFVHFLLMFYQALSFFQFQLFCILLLLLLIFQLCINIAFYSYLKAFLPLFLSFISYFSESVIIAHEQIP